MTDQATKKQRCPRRTAYAKQAESHRRKHQQPWEDTRRQPKRDCCTGAPWRHIEPRRREEIQQCKHNADGIVREQRDHELMANRCRLFDTGVPHVPSGYRSDPSAEQGRGQRCHYVGHSREGDQNIHYCRRDDSQQQHSTD